MNRDLDFRDGPRDECGVFGVYAPERDVARLAYFALYALQHRGQESAGIAATQAGQIMTVRDLGLVSQVFDEEKLRGRLGRSLPPLDLPAHADALVRVRAAVRSGELPTAHDVSDGGLACALAECCIEGGVGARVSLGSTEVALFGEGPGGVVVAGPRDAIEALDGAIVLGEVGGDTLDIDGILTVRVSALCAAYADAIPSAFAA